MGGTGGEGVRERGIEYHALPSQQRFHESGARFKGFSGPIGSGKSQALCQEALKLAYLNPGRTGLLGAPTFPMLRDATQAALIEILERNRIPHEWNRAESYLRLSETRSRILFRAVEEFERLRGSNLAWFGLDELTYAPREAWLRLEGRLRDPKATRLCGFAVWTPKGFDWVYERFVGAPVEGYDTVQARPFENQFLLERVPDYYQRLKHSYDGRFYEQEVLGQYDVPLTAACGEAFAPAGDSLVGMRLEQIQAALRDEGLDGWLFFDHHRRDPLAYRVLQFTPGSMVTRRWFYYIPAAGEPRGLVHKIEAQTLAPLPGQHFLYAGWSTLVDGLKTIIGGGRRVAMQYSPNCAVPYVAMVDAGTVELVRGLGVEVVTSANLIQFFESRWTEDQLMMHLEAACKVDAIRRQAFERVGAKQRASERVTEWEMQQFILSRFAEEGLTTDHGPDIAVNANASNPHYEPKQDASAEIKRGDLVLMDMWAKLDRPDAVFYDITWLGFCGTEPPAKVERVFTVVRDARDRAIARVKDAVRDKRELHGFEVDDAAREHVRAQGFEEFFFHRTGHSIGTEVHGSGANMDNLETHDERRVIPWTCFSVEPGIYLPEFGIRLEVDVFVGDREARVTGEVQDKLVLI